MIDLFTRLSAVDAGLIGFALGVALSILIFAAVLAFDCRADRDRP